MARSPIDNIDIELFQDDLENIDQEFLQSKLHMLMVKKYAPWLSLKRKMTKPQQIPLLNDMKIVQVDYGSNFVVILTDNGQVFLASNVESYWKTNNNLRLINTGNNRFKMIACGQHYLLLLRQDGHVFAMGDNSYGQITGYKKSYESMKHIDNLENVKLIVCGMRHSFSITNKGEIYSWDINNCGQLGLGDQKNRNTPCLVAYPNADLINIRIKDIVAGYQHSLFLFENGQLWGCGSNNHGELGLGDKNNRLILTKIPIENVQQIACSKFYSFSLAYDGSSKLDDSHSSFASALTMILSSPLTFGLTSIIHEFGSLDSISYQCKSIIQLFDNQDSYDVEFLIDEKHIKASKCYLKSVSEYYRLMFSGNWIENDQVIITDYSYETYYAYLWMLHTGKIHINRQNITELVDLANCYGDESLMKYCATFIRNDLDEQTTPTYRTFIIKYEIKELYDKIGHLDKNRQQSSSKFF
ncbi:hypothetical protein HUG17_9334 [Dermatophagoides farinae]|uniref:BTB domain-containing protein n=1 Tax=Dermatophagoides farinae TaxID=6954 RepID=A0A9D4SE07_DERFA|nr:hypothetical protein HUG17_9334 [Dermatophagoides farinae]